MKRILTLNGIKLVANLIILFIVLSWTAMVLSKTHKLISNPDEINIVKLDVPWYHPGDKVAILMDQAALAENPEFHRKLQISVFIYDLAQRIVYMPIIIIILVLLKRLIVPIYTKTYFDSKSISIINFLALAVALYVLCKFLFYQLIPIFIPLDLMVETVNFTTMGESLWGNLMAAIDFKMLFVSLCLYVIFVAFKEGHQLKNEAELTI